MWITNSDIFLESKSKFGFVYKITNLTNGKSYIGKRAFTHRGWLDYYGSCKPLINDVNVLGKHMFSRVIIEFCETKQLLNEKEEEWQSIYEVLSSPNFYNQNTGGRLFCFKSHTPESKLKLSLSKKGKTWEEIYGQENCEQRKKSLHMRNISDTNINRLKAHLKGKTWEEIGGVEGCKERKKKLKQRLIARWASPAFKEKNAQIRRAVWDKWREKKLPIRIQYNTTSFVYKTEAEAIENGWPITLIYKIKKTQKFIYKKQSPINVKGILKKTFEPGDIIQYYIIHD